MRISSTLGLAMLLAVFGCGGGGGGSPPGSVNINPKNVTLTLGDNQTFGATITGSPGAGVTWAVAEPGGGTITAAGFYTAPGAPGTYHVVATSQLDPTQTAAATITVQAGSAQGTIQ